MGEGADRDQVGTRVGVGAGILVGDAAGRLDRHAGAGATRPGGDARGGLVVDQEVVDASGERLLELAFGGGARPDWWYYGVTVKGALVAKGGGGTLAPVSV